MSELFNQLTSLAYTTIKLDCPVLSGNMKAHIKVKTKDTNNCIITIEAPSYDLDKWERTGVIEHDMKYDYAVSVNKLGAFGGRSKKSKHWLNKTLKRVCDSIALNYQNVEVINELEL